MVSGFVTSPRDLSKIALGLARLMEIRVKFCKSCSLGRMFSIVNFLRSFDPPAAGCGPADQGRQSKSHGWSGCTLKAFTPA